MTPMPLPAARAQGWNRENARKQRADGRGTSPALAGLDVLLRRAGFASFFDSRTP
jgi:hypothetical protein